MFGDTHTRDLISDYPKNDELEKTAFCDLSSIIRIDYDIGTHIRCLKVTTANGKSSEKIGGFELKKKVDFSEKEIHKVIFTRFKNERKIG